MRLKGSKTTKDCWKCRIFHINPNIVLFDENFSTLQDIADSLGLSYSQVCELGPNGRKKKNTFKFYPEIVIERTLGQSSISSSISLPNLADFSESIGTENN